DGLLTYDNHGAIIPGAARSWTVSDDGLTFRFDLRPDGRWSIGEPVTADDFVYAFRRILAPATAAKYAEILFPARGAAAVNRGEAAGDALGVAAEGPLRLRIALEQPTPYVLELLT
ncbi:ABC transporter substrate-binding protein, partial [Methylobacterium mesophilicum]